MLHLLHSLPDAWTTTNCIFVSTLSSLVIPATVSCSYLKPCLSVFDIKVGKKCSFVPLEILPKGSGHLRLLFSTITHVWEQVAASQDVGSYRIQCF
jgi:hypothetical protein